MYKLDSFRGTLINSGTQIMWEWTYATGGQPEAGATITIYEIVGGHGDVLLGQISPDTSMPTRPTEYVDANWQQAHTSTSSGDFPLANIPSGTSYTENVTEQAMYSRYLVIRGSQGTYVGPVVTLQKTVTSQYKFSWELSDGSNNTTLGTVLDNACSMSSNGYFPTDNVRVIVTPVLYGVEYPDLAGAFSAGSYSYTKEYCASSINMATVTSDYFDYIEVYFNTFDDILFSRISLNNDQTDSFKLRDAESSLVSETMSSQFTIPNDYSEKSTIRMSVWNNVRHLNEGLAQTIAGTLVTNKLGAKIIIVWPESKLFDYKLTLTNPYVEKTKIDISLNNAQKGKFKFRDAIKFESTAPFASRFTIVTMRPEKAQILVNTNNNYKYKGTIYLLLNNDGPKLPNGMLQDIEYSPLPLWDPMYPENGSVAAEIRDVLFNSMYQNVDIYSEVHNVRVLCVGDSITAGAPLFDPNSGGNIQSQYPYWLQLRLGEDYEVINGGTGRQNTGSLFARQDDMNLGKMVPKYRPQYVILLIGTNDIFDLDMDKDNLLPQVIDTAMANIKNIVQYLQANAAAPILSTCIPRTPLTEIRRKALMELNQRIRDYAHNPSEDPDVQVTPLDLIDFYEAKDPETGAYLFDVKDSNGNSTGVLNPLYTYPNDGTHLTIEGYKQMAKSINIGIFTSFRADIRLFREVKPREYDENGNILPIEALISSEEPHTSWNSYEITMGEVKRLQTRIFNRYVKNTGNSTGLFILRKDASVKGNVVKLSWDGVKWSNELIGMIDPGETKKIIVRFDLPVAGNTATARVKLLSREYRK